MPPRHRFLDVANGTTTEHYRRYGIIFHTRSGNRKTLRAADLGFPELFARLGGSCDDGGY
jgi:hypothetical protein